MELKKPELLNSRVAYSARKMELVEEELKFPDGHIETWEYARLKEVGAKILAVTDNNELIFVREYRGAAAKYVLRIPTGAIEKGETPEQAAIRELQEEAGFLPQKLVLIEEQKPMSTFFKASAFIFFATNLEASTLERDPGEKDMEIVTIPLEKVYTMVDNLEIEDPQTIYSILRLKKYLRLMTS